MDLSRALQIVSRTDPGIVRASQRRQVGLGDLELAVQQRAVDVEGAAEVLRGQDRVDRDARGPGEPVAPAGQAGQQRRVPLQLPVRVRGRAAGLTRPAPGQVGEAERARAGPGQRNRPCLDCGRLPGGPRERLAEAVGDQCEVLMDGGIRSGLDVVKALALGARACMIGRAYIYGLGAMGKAGVAKAIDILEKELSVAMALTGTNRIADIDRHVIAGAEAAAAPAKKPRAARKKVEKKAAE